MRDMGARCMVGNAIERVGGHSDNSTKNLKAFGKHETGTILILGHP
jgi:hypothetical protein